MKHFWKRTFAGSAGGSALFYAIADHHRSIVERQLNFPRQRHGHVGQSSLWWPYRAGASIRRGASMGAHLAMPSQRHDSMAWLHGGSSFTSTKCNPMPFHHHRPSDGLNTILDCSRHVPKPTQSCTPYQYSQCSCLTGRRLSSSRWNCHFGMKWSNRATKRSLCVGCKRRSKSAAGGARKVRHLPGRRERFLGWEVKSEEFAAR